MTNSSHINELDAESDADERPLFDAIQTAEQKSITALLAESPDDAQFALSGRTDLNKPERPVRISYTRPLNKVRKVREKLGVETNREVGEGTFDYYYEHTVR